MKLSKRQWLNCGLTLLLLLIVGVVVWIAASPRSTPPPAVPEIVTYSTDKPSEEPPPKDFAWKGDPADPKRIKLPTIATEGFVQHVGVDQNKQVAVPSNIHMAGWFVDTVRPGHKGLSVIDGHVDGREQGGIFRQLQQLKKDDEFQIELGSGEVKRFRVVNITTVETAKAASVLFSQDPKIVSQLNLITCGGTFDRAKQQYDKRVIVTAALL
jgi:LPXTG-site transpeptidase (sortase) family protein